MNIISNESSEQCNVCMMFEVVIYRAGMVVNNVMFEMIFEAVIYHAATQT